MFRTLAAAAALLLIQLLAAAPSAACSGPNPGITSVAVKSVTPDGNLNRYELTGTVVNQGDAAQAKDTLQFVDIYLGEAGDKLDAKGIPPLAPGQSYTFSYSFVRSHDAGNGTTKLRFKMDMGSSAAQKCGPENAQTTVTF